jgi:hypothetical protein
MHNTNQDSELHGPDTQTPTRPQLDPRQTPQRDHTDNHNITPNSQVSDINPKTIQHKSGVIEGTCDICSRSSYDIKLKQYSFNQPATLMKITPPDTIEFIPNPNRLNIVACSTDLKLINRMQEESPSSTPGQLVKLARVYRFHNPINTGKSYDQTNKRGLLTRGKY